MIFAVHVYIRVIMAWGKPLFCSIINYGAAAIASSGNKSTDNHSGSIYLLTLEKCRCDKLPIWVSVLMSINISWLARLMLHSIFQRGNYKTLISLCYLMYYLHKVPITKWIQMTFNLLISFLYLWVPPRWKWKF